MRLQKSAQKINSILDLDELLEETVQQVCELFGCLETCILLKDTASDDLIVRATRGCSIHLKGSRFPSGEGLVSHAAKVGQTLYTRDVSLDPRFVSCGHVIQSEVDIPLKVRDRVIGVFNVSHPEIDAFSHPQRQLLEALAGHVAVAIDNATRFQSERLERERFRIEQEEARRIQESMLPKNHPHIEGFCIEGKSCPAGAVGGDYFDYIQMGDGRLGIVMADVSGKGLPAALLMSTTRAIVRSLARQSSSAAEILSLLNQNLIEDFPAEKFVTMIFAVLDPKAATLRIANAGHLPALLVHEGQSHFLTSDCGLPLGIMDSAYCETEIAMKPGCALVLYSDGITEAKNVDDEDYGSERLQLCAGKPELTAESVIADVVAFAGVMPQHDDSTVVVLWRD
jgi:phosphoserine phosphatase RsbU/P